MDGTKSSHVVVLTGEGYGYSQPPGSASEHTGRLGL